MALQKSIEVDDTGVLASYWKICEIYTNWYLKEATITLWGFKDQTARESGKKPLKKITFVFGQSNNNPFPFTLEGNSIAEGYTAVKNYVISVDEEGNKTFSEFNTAVDV